MEITQLTRLFTYVPFGCPSKVRKKIVLGKIGDCETKCNSVQLLLKRQYLLCTDNGWKRRKSCLVTVHSRWAKERRTQLWKVGEELCAGRVSPTSVVHVEMLLFQSSATNLPMQYFAWIEDWIASNVKFVCNASFCEYSLGSERHPLVKRPLLMIAATVKRRQRSQMASRTPIAIGDALIVSVWLSCLFSPKSPTWREHQFWAIS